MSTTIQNSIDGIKSSKENIRTAINNKGGTLDSNAKLSTFANAIDNLSTGMGVGRGLQSNSGSVSSMTRDITINETTTECVIVVSSVRSGGSASTHSCAKKSGADVTITTIQSRTESNWSNYGQAIVFTTTTFKIVKPKGASSVVRITVSSDYALQGIAVYNIYNS